MSFGLAPRVPMLAVGMQTLHGIRFLRVGRIGGMQLGLDARWVGVHGVGFVIVLILGTLAGQLGQESGSPLWMRLAQASLILPAMVLTSLGHELGHVLASLLAGLSVRAVVLTPQGGVTIRAGSDQPFVNFCTALAGPASNALLGMICVWLALTINQESPVKTIVIEVAALQLLTAVANLLPLGAMDGQRMLTALQAQQRGPALKTAT
jgi:Zn-dependent protease